MIVEGVVNFDFEITLLTVRTRDGIRFCPPIGHRQERGDYQESWQPTAMSETALAAAEFNPQTRLAELSVRFVGELIAVHRDAQGNVVEGDARAARKQRDVWTFARRMGQDDPNWQLVATAA